MIGELSVCHRESQTFHTVLHNVSSRNIMIVQDIMKGLTESEVVRTVFTAHKFQKLLLAKPCAARKDSCCPQCARL